MVNSLLIKSFCIYLIRLPSTYTTHLLKHETNGADVALSTETAEARSISSDLKTLSTESTESHKSAKTNPGRDTENSELVEIIQTCRNTAIET